MFILQMAQVPRFFSWPWSVRLRGSPPVSLDVVGALDQHAAGASGRVADAHPLGGRQQFDDQLDHHPRRVELAALLAGIVGKLLDQVFVGPAEEVGLGHAVVAERDLREVLNQAREHGVPVLGIAELPFVVVIDAGEDAFQGRCSAPPAPRRPCSASPRCWLPASGWCSTAPGPAQRTGVRPGRSTPLSPRRRPQRAFPPLPRTDPTAASGTAGRRCRTCSHYCR